MSFGLATLRTRFPVVSEPPGRNCRRAFGKGSAALLLSGLGGWWLP